MAGKVKPSPPYEELLTQLVYANTLAPTGLPVGDAMRLRIFVAVMQRMKKFHPDEYRHCRGAIASIAKYEAADERYVTAEDRARGFKEQLAVIAALPASRPNHNKYLIQAQQAAFRDCLTREQYRGKLSLQSRLDWFRSHWDQFTAMTALNQCVCQYRTSFEEFKRYANDRPNDLSTIANASDFFLAFTHHLQTVSAENLRKSLKAKS